MKKISLLTAITSVLLLVGCDNNDYIDQSKIDDYEVIFEELFGKIDQGHNFNMVRAVNISSNVSFSDYTLRVYDHAPNIGYGAHLLGEFKNLKKGTTELKCDVPRSVNTLYLTYEHDGLITYSTYAVPSDNKILATNAETVTAEGFRSTFSTTNPSISIPQTSDISGNPFFALSDWAYGRPWGVFSENFYKMLVGEDAASTESSGLLPFNLFKEKEDHSAYANDFIFEFDETRAVDGVDCITFYPVLYNTSQSNIVGYYLFDTATGHIFSEHDIFENDNDIDIYSLPKDGVDTHNHHDPDFLAVLTAAGDITPGTVTGNADNIIPFPAKDFCFDSYVPVYDTPENLTRKRITNTQDASGKGLEEGKFDNGTILGKAYQDLGFVPTWNNDLASFTWIKERFVYEFCNDASKNTAAEDNTFAFLKNVSLGQGLFKVESDGFFRHGDKEKGEQPSTRTRAFLRANGAHTVIQDKGGWTEITADVSMKDLYDLAPDAGKGETYPTDLYTHEEKANYSSRYANWWFDQGRSTTSAYFYLDNKSDGYNTKDVQIGIEGVFRGGESSKSSWFAGGNMRLYKLADRLPRYNCKAVLGKPCTVKLQRGQSLGFYIKPNSGSKKIYYSETSRNPGNVSQCLYASVKVGDSNYGIIGLEDKGLDTSASDKDFNDIVLFIDHQATKEQEKPMVYTIAYEDLSTTDDFDFNDLVLQITHVSGTTEAQVKVKCAGGFKPIQVNFGDHVIWSRINAAYGEENDAVIINTNGETYLEAAAIPYPKKSKVFDPIKTITVPQEFTFADDASEFYIYVTFDDGDAGGYRSNDLHLKISPNETNKVPHAIVLASDNWLWPKEKARIDLGYPWFSEWVQEKSKLDWLYKDVRPEYLYEGVYDKGTQEQGQ